MIKKEKEKEQKYEQKFKTIELPIIKQLELWEQKLKKKKKPNESHQYLPNHS